MRVLLVDDDLFVRQVLAEYLTTGGVDVAGLCVNGRDAVEFLTHETADVVVMDVRMPVMNGVDATAAITTRQPELPVLMLTSFDDMDAIELALQAGAAGFLMKDVRPDALVAAVRAASTGLHVLAPSVQQRLRRARGGAQVPFDLDERERAVLSGVSHGHSNGEIAATLFLSESTVKATINSLQRKVGVANRVRLAVRAHDLGLDREGSGCWRRPDGRPQVR